MKEKTNSGQFWRRIMITSPFLMPRFDSPAAVFRQRRWVSANEYVFEVEAEIKHGRSENCEIFSKQ